MMDWSWLSYMGPSAASLVVMYFFLDYVRKRDLDNKDLMGRVEILVGRVEDMGKENRQYQDSVKNEFVQSRREDRVQNQQIVDTLFGVTEKIATTMAVHTVKVTELSNIM